MKKLLAILLSTLTILLVTPNLTFAQTGMMGSFGQPTPSQSDLYNEQTMQDGGQTLYQNLQDKKITCQNLTNEDFEKLGEYFMGQAAGSTQNHVYWDQRIQQMMGENGDTQMHMVWGERGSECFVNASLPSNTPSFVRGMMGNQLGGGGGVMSMMGWGYGWNGNFGWGFGLFAGIVWLLIVVDLILVGIWLFQQVRSAKKR